MKQPPSPPEPRKLYGDYRQVKKVRSAYGRVVIVTCLLSNIYLIPILLYWRILPNNFHSGIAFGVWAILVSITFLVCFLNELLKQKGI
jgi:ABC-type sulfate transport system permease component